MFENPEYEVDKTTEEYRLLKPLLTQLDKSKIKKLERKYAAMEEDGENKDEGSTDDDLFSENESSDDDAEDNSKWKEVKKEHKKIQRERRRNDFNDDEIEDESKQQKSIEMRDIDTFKINELSQKIVKTSLGARVAKEKDKPKVELISGLGNRQMSFNMEKKVSRAALKRQEELKIHREERKKVIRPTTNLKKRK